MIICFVQGRHIAFWLQSIPWRSWLCHFLFDCGHPPEIPASEAGVVNLDALASCARLRTLHFESLDNRSFDGLGALKQVRHIKFSELRLAEKCRHAQLLLQPALTGGV